MRNALFAFAIVFLLLIPAVRYINAGADQKREYTRTWIRTRPTVEQVPDGELRWVCWIDSINYRHTLQRFPGKLIRTYPFNSTPWWDGPDTEPMDQFYVKDD